MQSAECKGAECGVQRAHVTASRLAEMNQFAFQSILAAREIPVHYGIEEFREDLRTIEALERR